MMHKRMTAMSHTYLVQKYSDFIYPVVSIHLRIVHTRWCKMLYKVCVSLLLLTATLTQAQEIVGPKSAKTSELVKLKILKFEGDDPKYVCSPENNDWSLYKTLDGQLEIVFHTKVAKAYTFTLANNKDKKTILLSHTIEISKAGIDLDDNVKPVVIPAQLRDDMKAAYLVSPDADKRAILLKVYQDTLAQADDFENYGEAASLLSNLTKKRQASMEDLRGVKNVVEKYFIKELTNDKNAWNKDKFKITMTNVISVLAELRP
jgi:hypothetical protein